MKSILIAGIGNIFHGDDGFGVCVAQKMARSQLPEGLEAADFGIRGLDLAYALTGGYRMAVLIDTVQRGGSPGTLYVIEPREACSEFADADVAGISPHEMDPASVLRLAQVIGGDCAHVVLVGCEPQTFGDPDAGQIGLSDAVAAAVDEAAAMATALGTAWLREQGPAAAGMLFQEINQ